MKVQTYINEGPGMLWAYRPGDRLAVGPVVALADPAPSTWAGLTAEQIDAEIADRVWVVGNRRSRDADGVAWPRNVRSLSTGDVIVIGEQAWTVASVGWERVDVGDLLRSLDPEQSTRREGFRPTVAPAYFLPGRTDAEVEAEYAEYGAGAR